MASIRPTISFKVPPPSRPYKLPTEKMGLQVGLPQVVVLEADPGIPVPPRADGVGVREEMAPGAVGLDHPEDIKFCPEVPGPFPAGFLSPLEFKPGKKGLPGFLQGPGDLSCTACRGILYRRGRDPIHEKGPLFSWRPHRL